MCGIISFPKKGGFIHSVIVYFFACSNSQYILLQIFSALYDYYPTEEDNGPGKGLAFHFGDILHGSDASDDEWWLVSKILSEDGEEGSGIIPSKAKYMK